MNIENNAPAAAPNALQDFTSCPEWGIGGQFTYDPVTKLRTRTDAAPVPAGATNTDAPAAVTVESAAPGEVGSPAAVDAAVQPKKERTRG